MSNNIFQVFLAEKFSDDLSRFQYTAGQYIEFLLPHEKPKPYSIANAPNSQGEGILEFHIRHEAANPYSEKLVQYFKEQKNIEIKGPYGKLQYHAAPRLPSILIATGTGLAPCKAIIEQAFLDKHVMPMELYWGARNQEDLYFHDELLYYAQHHAAFSYYPVLDTRVYEVVLNRHRDFSGFHVYLGGHQEMVMTAQKLFGHPPYFYSDWVE